MQKFFLGNLFFIILLNLIIKPFYIFGIDVQVQNIVGAEDYGIYFALLNISFLFNMFLDLGITNYNTKRVAQNTDSPAQHIGSFFGVKLLLVIPYVLISVIFSLIIGYKGEEIYLLSLLLFNQILVGFILYMRSNFAGLHLFKIDALLSVLDRILLIAIIGSIIYGNIFRQQFKIEWFIYAQTISYLLAVLVGFILTRIKIGKIKLKFSGAFSITTLKQSFPYALLVIIMMTYTRVDAIMLERMLPDGKTQSGIYAQVFRLLDAVNMFAFLVAGILFPIFSRLISEKKSVLPILQTAGKLLIGIALVTSIGLAVNSTFTISAIYHENIEATAKAFIWLIICFIPLSVTHVFGSLLTANGNLKQLNILGLLGISFNIALNLYFIPKMQAEGAAIATLITQIIIASGQLILVLRIFKFSFQWRLVNQLFTLIVLYYFASWYLMDKYGHFWSFLATFCIGTLLLFALKMLNIKDMISLIRPRLKENEDKPF